MGKQPINRQPIVKQAISKEEMKKLAQREYYRKYRMNNKERIEEAQERFWTKQAELLLEIRSMPMPEQELDNDIID